MGVPGQHSPGLPCGLGSSGLGATGAPAEAGISACCLPCAGDPAGGTGGHPADRAAAQAPVPTLQGLDGGQSCHPGSPWPGLAGVRGLGPAATALITRSVQRPRRPPLSCSPPPAFQGHGAAGGGVSHSNASSLSIPRLKAQAGPTFQGNALSPPTPSPAPTPTDRGRGGCLDPSWGPSTQIRVRGAGQGGQPRGHCCSPSSDLGWHPEQDIEPRGAGDTGRGCLGSGVTTEAPVRPGSRGSCSPRQGPRGRWDSKKIPAKRGSRCGGAAGRAASEGQWLSLG